MVDRVSMDNFQRTRVRRVGQNIPRLYLTIDASNRTLNYSSSKRIRRVNSKSNAKKQCVEVGAQCVEVGTQCVEVEAKKLEVGTQCVEVVFLQKN